jgi:replicative DNA helicase
MSDITNSIIQGCLYNDDYMRGVIPHIELRYFEEDSHRIVYEALSQYVEKYNKSPSIDAIGIAINKRDDITDEIYQESRTLLVEMDSRKNETIEKDWLTDETESWCKERDLILAIQRSIMIVRGEDKEMTVNSLPELLQKSLSISFDQSIGHDFLEDAECRYDFYNEALQRVPFDIDYFNKITKGGTPNKTLNIIMGGTGGFKSGTMCHFAASNLFAGKNVLYITLELSEERVAERIDANMLDCEMDYLKDMDREEYVRKINAIKQQTSGRLIIKEYPTASAHAGHFRHLLRELSLKKDFKADIIYIDYLNICASSRCRGGENSYTLVKSIAEEIRGLAVEFDVPIWSATQTNRSGYSDSDVGLENTSESFGLPATADFFIAAITTPELDEQNLIMYKQLKNRYGAIGGDGDKFVVGINRAKMRLYDPEESAQDNISIMGKAESKSQKDVLEAAMQTPQFGKKAKLETAVPDFNGFVFE